MPSQNQVKITEQEERGPNQQSTNKRIFQKHVSQKFRLNDYDLIKLCIETNPKYLSQISKISENQASLLIHKKELFGYMYTAWTTFTKFLESQCIAKNKSIEFSLLGKFYSRKLNDGMQVVYVPSLDFINSGNFQFPQNEMNISPLS